ncbi:hypothetical protein [Streptomyces sp. NPDC001661]
MLCTTPRHMNGQPVPTEKHPQLTGIVLKDALVLAQRRIKDRKRQGLAGCRILVFTAPGTMWKWAIDAAHERRSVIVAAKVHPSGFGSIMPQTLATAAADRLLHHAHGLLTEDSSLRPPQDTTGQGVAPLRPAS